MLRLGWRSLVEPLVAKSIGNALKDYDKYKNNNYGQFDESPEAPSIQEQVQENKINAYKSLFQVYEHSTGAMAKAMDVGATPYKLISGPIAAVFAIHKLFNGDIEGGASDLLLLGAGKAFKVGYKIFAPIIKKIGGVAVNKALSNLSPIANKLLTGSWKIKPNPASPQGAKLVEETANYLDDVLGNVVKNVDKGFNGAISPNGKSFSGDINILIKNFHIEVKSGKVNLTQAILNAYYAGQQGAQYIYFAPKISSQAVSTFEKAVPGIKIFTEKKSLANYLKGAIK